MADDRVSATMVINAPAEAIFTGIGSLKCRIVPMTPLA